MNIILDTTAAIALLRGDAGVIKLLKSYEQKYLPIIVYAELMHGARVSAKPQSELHKFND